MTNGAVILFLTGAVLGFSSGLRCWKCISEDCDLNPEDNYKAQEVACGEHAECMKVRYRMYDNISYYDSIVRSCSSGPCTQSREEEFNECLVKRTYMVSGCALRTCCSDKDMCNSAYQFDNPHILWNVIVVVFLIAFLPYIY